MSRQHTSVNVAGNIFYGLLAGGTSEGGPPSVGVAPLPTYISIHCIFGSSPYWWDSCRPTSLTGGTKCLTGGTIVPPVKQLKYALRRSDTSRTQ